MRREEERPANKERVPGLMLHARGGPRFFVDTSIVNPARVYSECMVKEWL